MNESNSRYAVQSPCGDFLLAPEISEIARNGLKSAIAAETHGKVGEAIHWYDKAIAASPNFIEAHALRADRLYMLGRLPEALQGFERAIACNPCGSMLAHLHHTVGMTLAKMRRNAEAERAFSRAILLDPRSMQYLADRGSTRLRIENLVGGFDDFQLAEKLMFEELHVTRDRWWTGHEPLQGKRLLLDDAAPLDGIGDTFNFCRYAQLLAQRGAEVILKLRRPQLEALIKSLPGVSTISKDHQLPEYDYQIFLSRAVRVFERRVDAIYAPTGYLRANEALIGQWQKRLRHGNKPRVGIAWWTAPPTTRHLVDSLLLRDRPRRSILLRDLVAALPPDFEYISLQHQVQEIDEGTLRSSSIAYFGAEMTFDNAAAVMECCDLVIAIDSSLAHLAGALGRPVWVALPYIADWRWFSDRSDSPWYPTARLYRQSSEGNWSDVLRAIGIDLRNLNAPKLISIAR